MELDQEKYRIQSVVSKECICRIDADDRSKGEWVDEWVSDRSGEIADSQSVMKAMFS
jgi:hypothetical protein